MSRVFKSQLQMVTAFPLISCGFAMLNATTKLSIAILMLLSAGGAWAGEAAEAEALPPAVQTLIDKATQDVAKERAKYDAAAKKLMDKLVADLKPQVEKATKAGNLKLALAIQVKLEEAEKGSVVAKVDGQAKSTDLLGDEEVGPLVGKWGNSNVVRWEFFSDGTGKHYWGATTYALRWEKSGKGYTIHLEGPSPLRPLTMVDKNTISIEPGTSERMPEKRSK